MGLKSRNMVVSTKVPFKIWIKLSVVGVIILITFRFLFFSHSSAKTKSKNKLFHFDEAVATKITWDAATESISDELSYYKSNGIETMYRNIVIMHVGEISTLNSLDVYINNMKIFCSTIASHSRNSASHQAFYLFNVVGGNDNPLYSFIPLNLPNVAVIEWNTANSDMDTHFRTIKRLDRSLLLGFSAVVFLNQGVRGPLTHRSNGLWLGEYRKLLDNNNVGLVGSIISCEFEPHVQTHIFAMKTPSLHSVLFGTEKNGKVSSKFSGSDAKTWQEVVKVTEVALSSAILRGGQNISALLHHKRTGLSYFHEQCLTAPDGRENPTFWCDVTPEETIFSKWGGEPLRTPGLLCRATVERMRLALESLASAEPHLGLSTSETLYGGSLYDLYRQYGQEERMYRTRGGRGADVSLVTTTERRVEEDSKVCFLVRSASMHDSERFSPSEFNSTEPISYGVRELAESLIAQRNPNWLAFVFKTDPSPFGDRLQEILSHYGDDRLLYVAVQDEFLPVFTKADAGYTTTDHVLRTVLHDYPQCRWVSATNGDNAYGSGVVDTVMSSAAVNPVDALPVNMLLAPIDSRNFAEQDYDFRKEKQYWFRRDPKRHKPRQRSLRSALFPKSVPNEWHVRCEGVRANMEFNQLAYVSQPRPRAGKVDLASVFFRRSALLQENLYFGNFTNPSKYTCLGCQDGYLTEYLVRNRLWSYLRLPIDGLQSVIFHGPSPTLCIASGNVWFDHPHVDKVGCYSRRAVFRIHKLDGRGTQSRYDWGDFFKSSGICLRLSKHSFPNEPVATINI